MLSIGKLTLGQQAYYLDQVAHGMEDYYTGDGEAVGQWLASSAQLDLVGDVTAEQLRVVLGANDPTNTYKLAATTNRSIAGFDLTFSAPKSVSVLWGLSDRDVSMAVRDAHDRAVVTALDYMERHATSTRRGHAGVEVIPTKGMLAAGFRHRTSRNGDPHLHTHVVVPNVVEGLDGKWSTLDGRQLYAHARTAGFLYQAELRHQLTTTLGIAWTPVQRGTGEIEGVPTEVLRMFSTRRAEIEERLEILGQSSAAAAQRAVLATRQPKAELGSTNLADQWRERATGAGIDVRGLAAVMGRARPLELSTEHGSTIYEHLVGLRGLTEHSSSFDRRDVIRAIAGYAPTGLDARLVEAHADAFLTHTNVIALNADAKLVRYSTRELLDTEARLVSTAVARQRNSAGYCYAPRVNSVIYQYPTLSDEQAQLVAHLTTSGNGVDVVVAAAGTGKTFALDAARDVWERCGYHVHGAALAGRAATELENTAHIESSTIARLTKQVERIPLTQRDVIIIDEAGMAGTRQLAPILDAAAAGNAKVVLVGDYHQLPEINAGGLLRGLADRIAPVELTENRRQSEAWERRALIELRNGEVAKALNAYAEHERLHIAPNTPDARRQLVDAWLQATRNGDHSIMLAPQRHDVEQLNHLARQRLVEQQQLSGTVLTIDNTPFQRGDRVITLRNDYDLDIRNGTLATVTQVHPRRHELTIRTDHGKTHRLSRDYLDARNLDYGYAITIHKAQGITADRGLVLGTGDLSRELGYVALSRGRLSNDLFVAQTPERENAHALDATPVAPIEHLRRSLERSSERQLSIDS